MWTPNCAFTGTPSPSNFIKPWSGLHAFSSNIFDFYNCNILYILQHYFPIVHLPFQFIHNAICLSAHACHDGNTRIQILANQRQASPARIKLWCVNKEAKLQYSIHHFIYCENISAQSSVFLQFHHIKLNVYHSIHQLGVILHTRSMFCTWQLCVYTMGWSLGLTHVQHGLTVVFNNNIVLKYIIPISYFKRSSPSQRQ